MYKDQELIIFSLLFSKIEEGRFPKQSIDLKALYSLFKLSINMNINIFNQSIDDLEKLIEKSICELKKKNPRIKESSKEANLKNFFLNDKFNVNQLKNKANNEMKLCEENDIKYITYNSPNYPQSLKSIEEPPFVIFYKGKFPNEESLKKSLAVIGSRKPEKKYGNQVAKKVGKILSDNGWINISGLALGCDEFGHRGSIEGKLGITGAILPSGLLQPIYPLENQNLAKDILSNNGFLMSELPPSIKKSRLFLVLRDRLQSGMTRGVFVVETTVSGGTLHTVKYSLEQGRITIVWDPLKIKDILNVEEVQGNLSLLGIKDTKLKKVISKSLKNDIIGAKSSEELLDILKEKTKEDKALIQKSLM